MNLLDRLIEDMKIAMKSGARVRLSVIRQLRSQIKNAQLAPGKGGELTDDEVLQVISNAAKKAKEAIELYKQGNRQDLVEKESAELAIIQEYLPEQLSEDEIAKIVDSVIAEVNATSMQDMGRVMGKVMQQVRGKADGKLVQQLVRSKLQ